MRRPIWILLPLLWGCGGEVALQDGTSSTGNAVSVRILRPDGTPAAGIPAWLRRDGLDDSLFSSGRADSLGRVDFSSVPAGRWALETRDAVAGRITRFSLDGSRPLDLDTLRQGAFATVAGQALLPSGSGLCAVHLLGTGETILSDSQGNFAFAKASPGSQRIAALPRPDGSLGMIRWDTIHLDPAAIAILEPRLPEKPLDSSWTLAWEEDFDSLRTSRWTPDTGDGCPELCGWGASFLQRYASANAFVRDGALVLRAERTTSGWVSGSVNSRGKAEFEYGRLEARIWMPAVSGAWSIVSLQGDTVGGASWPASGGLDLASLWGYRPDSLMGIGHRVLADGSASHPAGIAVSAQGWSGRWMDIAVEWSPEEIVFLADDLVYHRVKGGVPFDHPFYWGLSLGVGGDGNIAPDSGEAPFELRIDRLRVWRRVP